MEVIARTNNANSEAKKMSLSEISEEFDRLISNSRKKWPSTPLYAYNLDGGICYSPSPPEEFFESQKAIEDFRSNPPVNKDPTFIQQQNDSICLKFFAKIQSIREELADHVLVEPMAVRRIMLAGLWGHLNFKAKHKDADDSCSAIYFAELDTINNKVTCLIKLDIDSSADTSAFECCALCHPTTPEEKDLPVSGVGCVYHPVDAKLFLRDGRRRYRQEFFKSREEIEDLDSNPMVDMDPMEPISVKEQDDLLCLQFFTKIQNIKEEKHKIFPSDSGENRDGRRRYRQEFFKSREEIEDLDSNPMVDMDPMEPISVKEQDDLLCLQFFTKIQNIKEEKHKIFPSDSGENRDGRRRYRQEFFKSREEIEDLDSNPMVDMDPMEPISVKEQDDLLCLQFFTKIQNIKEELADHVLVEPMAVYPMCIAGFWAHLNFKAKHKDAADSSSAIYFAELDVINNEVTCLAKLDIDLSADTSAYERCAFCNPHPEGNDLLASGLGRIYHPVDAKLFLR